MAWISVDQKLIGGKLRKLYKAIGCSQNEAIGILVSMWLWGLDNADMDGLIVSADRGDIAGSFREGLSSAIDASSVVDCLIETGWIDDVDGQLYLHDWEDWRSYYNRYMKAKRGNADRQAKYKERKKAEQKNAESNVTCDVTGNAPETETIAKPTKESKYGKEFEEFWTVYPRKADKGQAYKKYQARRKDGYSPDELLQAAQSYRSQCEKQRTDQQYIKHAKTFLSDSAPFLEFLSKQTRSQTTPKKVDPGVNPFR